MARAAALGRVALALLGVVLAVVDRDEAGGLGWVWAVAKVAGVALADRGGVALALLAVVAGCGWRGVPGGLSPRRHLAARLAAFPWRCWLWWLGVALALLAETSAKVF